MEKGKTKGKKYLDMNRVLEEFLARYPKVDLNSIELFTEVYYPVATLEIDLDEITFEDFDLVPLTILKMIDCGIKDPRSIASALGLSLNYVQKIFVLLRGYGHITENGLTESGKQSVQEQKKIIKTAVCQKFQADALTGDLLRLGQQISEENLIDKNGTLDRIGHIPYVKGITEAQINEQLARSDLNTYKKYKGTILNCNAAEIKSIRCTGLNYIKAYLLKLQGIKVPAVMTSFYDGTKKNFSERFTWKPIRVPEEQIYDRYGFDRDIPCYPEEALQTIHSVYRMICSRMQSVDEPRLVSMLGGVYPFDFSTMDITIDQVSAGLANKTGIYVNGSSFTKFEIWILDFLKNYSQENGYLFTHTKLNGITINFDTRDGSILRASKAYRKLTRHYEEKKIIRFLKNRFYGDPSKSVPGFSFELLIELFEEFERLEEDGSQASSAEE